VVAAIGVSTGLVDPLTNLARNSGSVVRCIWQPLAIKSGLFRNPVFRPSRKAVAGVSVGPGIQPRRPANGLRRPRARACGAGPIERGHRRRHVGDGSVASAIGLRRRRAAVGEFRRAWISDRPSAHPLAQVDYRDRMALDRRPHGFVQVDHLRCGWLRGWPTVVAGGRSRRCASCRSSRRVGRFEGGAHRPLHRRVGRDRLPRASRCIVARFRGSTRRTNAGRRGAQEPRFVWRSRDRGLDVEAIRCRADGYEKPDTDWRQRPCFDPEHR
jgi:hypothetical protein